MITYKNDSGSTPLHYLCSNTIYKLYSKIKIIKLFKNNILNLRNNHGSTPYDWLKIYSYKYFTDDEIIELYKILSY